MSDNDFADIQSYTARANFVNNRATRLSALFGRELPTLFGRVEPSATGGRPASTHPLPLIKLYVIFNSSDNKSGVKQRILKEVNHVISRLSSDITRNLSRSIVAKTVALNCLLQSRFIVEFLINWMETFYQELQCAGQPSAKDTWLLVCFCVRGYFAELRKIRVSASEAFSHAGDDSVVAGAYIWATL